MERVEDEQVSDLYGIVTAGVSVNPLHVTLVWCSPHPGTPYGVSLDYLHLKK